MMTFFEDAGSSGGAAVSRLPDRYEIRSKIGSGATGVVYRGYDLFAKRDVAIKIPHASVFANEPASVKARKGWLNEVQLAGSLQHPYIVGVYDAGAGDEFAYIVMEYLPKGTLAQFTHPGKLLPPCEVLELIFKCAAALEFAHRYGIVHRDIKPANLQYLGNGEVKVGDFGAAFFSKGGETQILDVGTLAYTAPEVFQGVVLPQSDIYSLGAVMFELLTGRRMFDGENSASFMYQALYAERPRLKDFRADLPEVFDKLLAGMVAADLKSRFKDWSEVLHVLEAASFVEADGADRKIVDSDQFRLLRRVDLMNEFDDAELIALIQISQWKRASQGSVLCREGGEANSIYFLSRGTARVLQKGKTIGWIEAGNFFGEVALAEQQPATRSATIVADGDVIIAKWPIIRLNKAKDNLKVKLYKLFFRIAVERVHKADARYLALYEQYLQNMNKKTET